MTVPNPAHSQFISRQSTDPREETKALSATRARQLMGLPDDDSLIDFRDRAISSDLPVLGNSVIDLVRLKISDFH